MCATCAHGRVLEGSGRVGGRHWKVGGRRWQVKESSVEDSERQRERAATGQGIVEPRKGSVKDSEKGSVEGQWKTV